MIARKTYRPREGCGHVYCLKKKFFIFLNDRFRLALVKTKYKQFYFKEFSLAQVRCLNVKTIQFQKNLNARKIFKRGNVNGKKVEEWRKGKEKKH